MVLLESCKGCGSGEFVVKDDGGYDFLVCAHCKKAVAILSDTKHIPSPTNRDFVSPSGAYIIDFRVMSSGIMYSGLPINYDFVIGT